MGAGRAAVRATDRPRHKDRAFEPERVVRAAPDRLEVAGRFNGRTDVSDARPVLIAHGDAGSHQPAATHEQRSHRLVEGGSWRATSSAARVRARLWVTPAAVVRAWTISLVACALVGTAPPTVQAQRERPSAQELWEDYPLHREAEGGDEGVPEAGKARSAAQLPEATAAPVQEKTLPRSARSDGDGPDALLLLGSAAAVVGWGAWLKARRRRGDEEDSAAPARGSAFEALQPPDPGAPWFAEVEWHQGSEGTWFRAIAQSPQAQDETVIGESSPIEWPPRSQAAVEGLTRASDELAASMSAAGWRPIDRGRARYARRFIWEPVDAAPAPAGERLAPARFRRPAQAGSEGEEVRQADPRSDRPAAVGEARADRATDNEEG